MKKRVVSWDIFDTLIARRCGTPRRLFEIVGEKLRMPEFVHLREAAERQVAYNSRGREYSLRHINRETAVAEFQEEVNQVFAVRQIADQVRDDDILVSDMYLSEDQIRVLLEHASIHTKAKIYVSNHGKANGKMWTRLVDEYDIAYHVGDSPHGDHTVPQRFGIKTVNPGTAFNGIEQFYSQYSEDVAWWVRNHRLQLAETEPTSAKLHLFQVECNAPLLLAACQELHDYVKKHKFTRVLFLSRDCCLFRRLWKRLHPDIASGYIYSSRDCWRTGSEGYANYLRTQMGLETVCFVDLATTTRSMTIGSSKMGLGRLCLYTPLFLDTKQFTSVLYESSSRQALFNNTYLEMLNYDQMWHVKDVVDGKPIFDDEGEYDMHLVEGCHQVFDEMVKDAPTTPIRDAAEVIKYAAQRIAADNRFFLDTFPGHMELERQRVYE